MTMKKQKYKLETIELEQEKTEVAIYYTSHNRKRFSIFIDEEEEVAREEKHLDALKKLQLLKQFLECLTIKYKQIQ